MGRERRLSSNSDQMAGISWFFIGLAVGSLMTFMMDPVQGRRRRALMRDKSVRFKHTLRDSSTRTYKDLRNRTQGAMAKAFHPTPMDVEDEKLMNRVRSEFGRLVRHPRAIETFVKDGIVTLSGPILADEIQPLLECVSNVVGVEDVVDQLEVHQTADGIPSLQGEGPEYLQ